MNDNNEIIQEARDAKSSSTVLFPIFAVSLFVIYFVCVWFF
jgi:nitrate reductase NapE component